MHQTKPIKSLIIAELDGEITIEEKEFLYLWISKSKDNACYYVQIKDLWEASLANVSEIAQTTQEWERFHRRIISIPIAKEKKYSLVNWYRVAAVLVIGLLIANLVFQEYKIKESLYFTTVAPRGSISQTILPDGTMIYLNAGSELRYELTENAKQRHVFLKGEAWFDVESDKNKPFVVHTPHYNVQVLGTQFNIKSYEDDDNIVTTLEEGAILISSSEHSSNSRQIKLKEDIVLKPGEQLVYNKADRTLLLKNKVDTRLFTSWKDHKLIFLDMSFGELVRLLERRYGVDIIVVDDSILEDHFTGTIKNETILEILNIIQHTHSIQYKLEGQQIIIQEK